MPSGDTGSMIMANVIFVILDCADHIAFHDLHMVNVIEKFEMITSDLIDKFNTPGSIVTLIIEMIDFAVEQFHHNLNIVLLRVFDNWIKSFGTIFNCYIIRYIIFIT